MKSESEKAAPKPPTLFGVDLEASKKAAPELRLLCADTVGKVVLFLIASFVVGKVIWMVVMW